MTIKVPYHPHDKCEREDRNWVCSTRFEHTLFIVTLSSILLVQSDFSIFLSL